MEREDTAIECFFSESMDTIDKRYIAHPKYEVFLLLEGDVTMLINSERYAIGNGALVLLNSRDLHISINNASSAYRRITVMFDHTAVQMLNSNNTNLLDCFTIATARQRNIIYLNQEQIEEFTGYAQRIKHGFHSCAYGDDLDALSGLISLLVLTNRVFRTHCSNAIPLPCSPIIRSIVDYVDEHLEEELTVKQLCEHFSYSEAYVSAQFSKQMGVPLKQFVLTKKIAHAKQLLKEQLSVMQVCERCAFGDYSNFIRTFKRMVGRAPLQWRKEQGR